ncbi:MAG: hypothetical protein H0T78_03650 [Longispora sp.]|nr:hypothetical protein [Longispora sp. (in: high G+C Gram-positive bacteria)]
MARTFRVDLPSLLGLRYPDRDVYLVELLRFAQASGAQQVRIVPADLNKGYFTLTHDGEGRVPDGRLPDDGLLAGLLASDNVTQLSGDGTRWVGRISGTHMMTPAPATKPDPDLPAETVITLRRRRGETLLNSETVERLARRYAEFSPISVEIAKPDGEFETVNRRAPWMTEDSPSGDRLDVMEYGADLLGIEPLDCVPLTMPGGESFGVAYILPFTPAPRETQRHQLYSDGLLLDDSGADMLPGWAFFARCVIDLGRLPTDRAAVREETGQALRTWLLLLSARQPQRLSRFVAVHHMALKAHAVHDRELAGIITRWLPFETSAGRLTITELLGRTRHIRYSPNRDAFRQLAPIAGRSKPFLNAGYLYDVELLAQLPELYEDVTVECLKVSDVLADMDEPPLAERSSHFRLLDVAAEALTETQCATVMKSFEPANLPAIYVDNPATLCLNHRSPIIAHLARLTDQTVLSRTVQLLYAQARLHSHSPLRGTDSDLLSRALLDLVGLAALEEDLNGLDHV